MADFSSDRVSNRSRGSRLSHSIENHHLVQSTPEIPTLRSHPSLRIRDRLAHHCSWWSRGLINPHIISTRYGYRYFFNSYHTFSKRQSIHLLNTIIKANYQISSADKRIFLYPKPHVSMRFRIYENLPDPAAIGITNQSNASSLPILLVV